MTTQPSEDALLLAHDAIRPEDGGDHLPVKLSSARSSTDTVMLATRIDALIQAERDKIATWLDCTENCQYAARIIDGACTSYGGFCHHYIADRIRRGERP